MGESTSLKQFNKKEAYPHPLNSIYSNTRLIFKHLGVNLQTLIAKEYYGKRPIEASFDKNKILKRNALIKKSETHKKKRERQKQRILNKRLRHNALFN